MLRWLIPPKLAAVAKYIESYWYIEKRSESDGVKSPKLNPDPSAHLILAPAEQTYQYKTDNASSNGVGSHWLYPHVDTFELDHAKAFACIGIKFKIGALYSPNKVDFTQALLDTVQGIQLANIEELPVLNEATLLAKAQSSPEECCSMLDELLIPWLAKSIEDKHSELTRQVLPLLTDKPINMLGEVLFCSQRTLERSFVKVTGLTLKQCQSMQKLEAILEFLYQRPASEIDWVDIAYQFGFSDQPHLIRYLKGQIDLTPKSYAKQRGFTIDVYGGVEEMINRVQGEAKNRKIEK